MKLRDIEESCIVHPVLSNDKIPRTVVQNIDIDTILWSCSDITS